MDKKSITQALKSIGLTAGEIRVYFALLKLGSSSTGSIIKMSKVSGSKVYEVLDRLIEKGLATVVEKNGVNYYDATNPERIHDYLEEKKKSIQSDQTTVERILPELLLMRQFAKKGEARIYKGWEGMKSANQDIINTLKKGEEWLEMGLSEQPKTWEIYFNKKQKVRAKKGIVHKALINIKYQTLYHARRKLPHTEYRFLPEKFNMPMSTEIYGSKVAFFVLEEQDPMVIVIESKAVADSFRQYFYALWEQSKYPTKIYYGFDGPRLVLKQLAEAGQQGLPNYGYGTAENPYEMRFLKKDLREFFDAEKKYRITTQLIFATGTKYKQPNAEIRYLPREYMSPVRTMIAGNKVFTVDFTKPITTIIIESKEIANAFKRHFKFMWELAKPKD